MDNIENIPLILHQIEGEFNALEIEKEKLTSPGFFDPVIVNNEIARLEDEILPMKKLLMSEKDIQRQKDLMKRQISCKDFEMEAENLLKERDAIITAEIKNKITEALKSSLVETFQSNEFPNFENIEKCFTLLEEKQDQRLIEEKVIFQNGNFTFNKLWVWRSKEGDWKVLNLVED